MLANMSIATLYVLYSVLRFAIIFVNFDHVVHHMPV